MRHLSSFAHATLAAFAMAVTCLLPGVAAADTLTFDNPQSCGSSGTGESRFLANAGTLFVSQAASTCTTQGLTFAVASAGRGQTITITAANGAPFSVSAFDGGSGVPSRTGLTDAQIQQPATNNGGASRTVTQTITVTGTRADGTTATFSYNNYAPNQTFNLGPSFSDLATLRFSTDGTLVFTETFNVNSAGFYVSSGSSSIFPLGFVSPIDNLQFSTVAPVPEPSTFALFGVPLAFLVIWQRRRQRGAQLALQSETAASAGA
jgi:hypothetical protein